MHPKKAEYSDKVYLLIRETCANLAENKDRPIAEVLRLSDNDMRAVIDKIMIALPDPYFYNATPFVLADMIDLIAHDLILFQVQENIEDPIYPYDLINFISGLSSSIANRYKYH